MNAALRGATAAYAALDRVIRFEDRADQLHFDMGEWSDGKPVHPIQVFLPD
jgi:hypothetical protein